MQQNFKQSRQSIKKTKPLAQATLAMRLSLVICLFALTTGCTDEDKPVSSTFNKTLDQFNDSKTQKTSNDSDKAFCYRYSQPFSYALCEVNQQRLTNDANLALRLFWRQQSVQNSVTLSDNNTNSDSNTNVDVSVDVSNDILYTFDALLNTLSTHNKHANNADTTLKFAVNAGMYNSEFAPIGYTVLQGKQLLSLNLNDGGGNFHLLPNGIFWWDKKGRAYVTESQAMAEKLNKKDFMPWYATQSGPMLVINGEIHPKFKVDSTSKKTRNGVGICNDDHIKFVNSQQPVNFYQFAQLFKDDLGCDNALFLDGGIASAMYAPAIGIHDKKNMGVMIGLVETP